MSYNRCASGGGLDTIYAGAQRMSRLTTLLLATFVVIHSHPAAAQARLVLRDSIRLQQRGDVFLSLPAAAAADSAGYLVTDDQEPQVLAFSRRGALLRRYGRKGEGPGEFREAVAAFPYKKDRVIVFSRVPPAAQVFDRASGAFVEEFRLTTPIMSARVVTGRVWIGGNRYATRTGLHRLVLGNDHETDLAPLPGNFENMGPLGGFFPMVSFAVWSDTVLVGFEPSGTLTLLLDDGTVLDTIPIPARRRRGVPDDPSGTLLRFMHTRSYDKVFGLLSALRGMHHNADGTTTLVYFDSRPETPPVTSEMFVSVLSADRTRACVDARVPLHPEAQPTFGFDGDELVVLEQVIEGAEAVPVLKHYRVDTSGCDWIGTKGR
jgi:hypothetical protein